MKRLKSAITTFLNTRISLDILIVKFIFSISDNIVLYGLFTDCTDKIASKYAAKHLPIEFLNLWKEQVEKPDIELMLKMVNKEGVISRYDLLLMQ